MAGGVRLGAVALVLASIGSASPARAEGRLSLPLEVSAWSQVPMPGLELGFAWRNASDAIAPEAAVGVTLHPVIDSGLTTVLLVGAGVRGPIVAAEWGSLEWSARGELGHRVGFTWGARAGLDGQVELGALGLGLGLFARLQARGYESSLGGGAQLNLLFW